jgi:hypothetical protein
VWLVYDPRGMTGVKRPPGPGWLGCYRVAQGFINNVTGQDPDDIALCYFNEIVNRSIVQPAFTDSNDDVLSCRVHDMMLDLIINKCREENFVTATDDIQDITGMLKKVRNLSLYLNGVTDGKSLGTIQLSHVREH